METKLSNQLKSYKGLTTALNFDHITLTPEEEAAAIFEAKARKHGMLLDRQEAERKQQKLNEFARQWTVKEFIENMKKEASKFMGSEFVVDDDNYHAVMSIAQYFTGDQEFEKIPGQSFEKSLLIVGGVGTGKTALMHGARFNKKQCFVVVPTVKIVNHILEHGVESYAVFTWPSSMGNQEQYFGQKTIGWTYDDLGAEEQLNSFGNRREAMVDIIKSRYNDDWRFMNAHMTSNLNAEMIRKRYGDRFASRMREMYNVITLTGPDRRK